MKHPQALLSEQPTNYLFRLAAQYRAMARTATTQDVADALNRLAGRFETRAAMRDWAAVDKLIQRYG